MTLFCYTSCVAFEFFACLILLFLYDNPCMRLSLLVRRVILAFTAISYAVSGTLVADPIQIDVKTGTDVKDATGIKEEYALNIIGDVTVKATELNSVWGTYDELFFGSDYTISSEDGQSSLHFSGKSRTGLEKLFCDCNVTISNLKDVSISDHYNMASTPDYENGTWSQPWNYTAREFGALINSTVVVKDLGGSFTIQNNSTESSHWAISQGDATVNGGLLNIYGSFINISGGVNITNNYVKEAPTISHLIGKFVDREFYVYGGMGDVSNLKFMGNRTGIHIDGNYVYQEFFRGTEGQGYGGAFCLSGAEGNIFSGNAGLLSVSDNYLHMATIAQGGAFYLWPKCGLTITGQKDDTENQIAAHVLFSGNHLDIKNIRGIERWEMAADGGAVYLAGSSVFTISDNAGVVEFSDNRIFADASEVGNDHDIECTARGGAVYLGDSAEFQITGNETVLFNGNTVEMDYPEQKETTRWTAGGAIFAEKNSTIEFSNNSNQVIFSHNSALGIAEDIAGGAIALYHGSTLTFKNNVPATSTSKPGVLFEGNTAEEGGAIYMGADTLLSLEQNQWVEFRDNQAVYGGALCARGNTGLQMNDNVLFTGNTAEVGGALYVYGELTINGELLSLEFDGNKAYYAGALAVALESSLVISGNKVDILFQNNESVYGGGAIYSYSDFTFADNQSGQICFRDNTDSTHGGAIYVVGKTEFSRNGTAILFEGNSSQLGGAICLEEALLFSDNRGAISFADNRAATQGGAIASVSTVTFDSNTGLISFNDNEAQSGAAISTAGLNILSNSGGLKFVNNSSHAGAGAIDAAVANISGNEAPIAFAGNSGVYGGAVAGAELTFSNNKGALAFIANVARGSDGSATDSFGAGGAFYISPGSSAGAAGIANLSDNAGRLLFLANRADNTGAMGGAIYAKDSTLNICNNEGNILFAANESAGSGGAIALQGSVLNIQNNQSVEFLYNTAAETGGAIAVDADSTMQLHDNKTVLFSQNSAAYGSAIYSEGIVSIRNNESVTFSHQAGSAIHLAIDTLKSDPNRAQLSLSAAEGKSILFDGTGIRTQRTGGSSSIRIDLNADAGASALYQTGDIVFRGTDSKSNLYSAAVTLHGGHLLLQDKSQMYLDGYFNNHANVELSDGAQLSVTNYSGTNNSTLQVRDSSLLAQTVSLEYAYARFENAQFGKQPGAVNAAEIRVDSYSELTLAGGNTIDGNISLTNGGILSLSGHNVLNGTLNASKGEDYLQFSIQDDSNLLFSYNTVAEVSQLRAETMTWENLRELSDKWYHEVTLDIEPTAAGGTYVLLSLENGISEQSWKDNWTTPANVYWLDANTLVYKHEVDDLVWMNGQETYLWNSSDTNWQKMKDGSPAGVDVSYYNGGRVYFTDDCQDAKAVVLAEDVFMEQMTVSATRDYEFVSIGGKITHDTVLVKEGSGKLSINFNNDFVGGVELKEGIIHVGADYALGKGKLVTKEGTVLEIGSGVHAMIEHGSSSVSGAIALADDAVIEFGGNFLASGPQSLSGNGKLILSAPKAGLSVLGAYEGNADFEVTGANAELRFYNSANLGEGSSIKLRNGAGFFMYEAPLSLTGTIVDAAGVANVLSASPGLSIGSSSTALHFDISGDNLYANGLTENAILKVDGKVQHNGYTLHVDAAGLEYGKTYVLMTCDASFAGQGINVTGAATSTDLQWLNNNTTLVYTHNAKEYVWMNDTGSGEWNKHDANWHYGDSVVVYGDGVNVVFNDACKDDSAVTLVQDVAPESVLVDAERDYTFTSDGGKITGATGITKNGSGTLELRLDNDFTGDVMLNEGTLVAAADHALGNGLLTVKNGATLEIAGPGTHVTTTGSSIAGSLKVNQWAQLSVESPVQFSAAALQVDGTLRLSTAAQDAHADSLSGAGQMYVSGGGSVSLGSLASDSAEFGGTLSVTGAHVTLQNADSISKGTIELHGAGGSMSLQSTGNTSSFIQQASLSMENGARVQLPGVTDPEKGTLHLQGATLSVSGSGNVVDGHLKFSMHESKPVTLNFTLTGEETAPLLHADSLDWQKGVHATINIDFTGDIVEGRYVLLDLDSSMPANSVTDMPECWSAAYVNVTGDASFADLEWVCKGDAMFGQLVLDAAPINGLVWNNASGSQDWNYTDVNWSNGTDDVSYINDKTIYFLDYKGPDRIKPLDNADYTVHLDPGDDLNNPNVFRPQEIIVDTEKRYEFYEVQYAEAPSGRIEGAELIKKGTGTLALYADNNVFSGIQLLEGTLVVGFDGSIDIEPGETGTGCFTSAVGTTLQLEKRASADITTDGSSIRGAVVIDSTSELIYSAPHGYWAESTHVEGDLTFSGDFRSSANVANSVSAGELSGSGAVNLAAARAGALAYFARNNGFTGNLNADNGGTLMFGEGGYASESGRLSAKNGAQIIFRDQDVNLSASSGISLQQGGTFEAHTVKIASGATLEATGAYNVLQTNGILLENGFVSLQFGADNIYTEDGNNAVLTVNGGWNVAGNNTFTFTNAEGIETGVSYYLLSVEKGFDISKWNTESTTVQGVAFSDLKWIDDNTKLIYQHSAQDLVWMNSAGTQKWDFRDANWVQKDSTAVMLFHNGDSVHFTDASPSSANTVTLDTAVAPKNVYVESDANNFIFTGEGKLTGDLALYKTGESTLTIKTNNDFTGTVQLSEGSLCLYADAALGAAALQTSGVSTLRVGNTADVYLNTADSRINGNVVVDTDAELRVGNAVVWDNTRTEVNGTLVFEGDFSQSTAVSGVVAGTGTIVHAGTAEHVDGNVITIRGFETSPQVNFTAENSGIIHFDLEDKYFGGGVFSASSGGTLRFNQTVYLHLGNFVLNDGGIIEAPEIIDSITSAYIFGVNNRVETEKGMGISTFYFFAGQANTYTNSSDVAALQVKGDFYSYSSNYYLTLLEAVSSGTTLLLMNLEKPNPDSKDPEKLHLPEHCMWIEGDSKLVYVQPSQDLVWMNSSASGVWNHDDANWQVGEYANAISFTDADRVFFTDACTDASDVQISTAVAPAHIEVNAENRDYVFSGNGKITGETALVKTGAGSLAIATDNDFCGGVDLQQGTLRLRADDALGSSSLKTASGTTLVVENEADVSLNFTAEDSPLKSDIQVDTGASLTLAGNYIASSSVSLAGNGKLRFNAENGQILFSSMAAFGGELSVVAAGSGVSVESGYSGAAALRVLGAETQMSFAGDVLLEHGGSLQVAENAVFAIDSITGSLELASGATLHAGVAAIAAASSLALEDVACPALAVQHVELCGGSTYVQDGAYFTLTGDANSLAFKGDGVIRLKTTLDYTVTEDGLHRFILFDGVEESITLSDSVSFSIVGYEGLETNVVQIGSSVYLQVVPEPATATLGLLALVALTARRRRK